jgi:hypothetical protein
VLGIGLALGVAVVDPAGRLLLGAGALLVFSLVALDVLIRPRLSAGPGGVDVRRLTGGVHLPWSLLRVRVREERRLGMRSRTLELDSAAPGNDEGVLVVLGRRDLGADPETVARQLRRLDPTGG